MASTKQSQAAKRNIRTARTAARRKRTIASLPRSVRQDMGRQGAKARQRGGRAGRSYEDRTRSQLYGVAEEKGIQGRSKMGKWDLIDALRKAG